MFATILTWNGGVDIFYCDVKWVTSDRVEKVVYPMTDDSYHTSITRGCLLWMILIMVHTEQSLEIWWRLRFAIFLPIFLCSSFIFFVYVCVCVSVSVCVHLLTKSFHFNFPNVCLYMELSHLPPSLLSLLSSIISVWMATSSLVFLLLFMFLYNIFFTQHVKGILAMEIWS